MKPENIQALVTIITAVVSAILPFTIEQIWRSVQQKKRKPPVILLPEGVVIPPRKPRISWRVVLAFSLLLAIPGGFAGYFWGTRLAGSPFVLNDGSTQNDSLPATPSTATPTTSAITSPVPGIISTPTTTPTPIPRGEPLMEINFAWRDDGRCNDYDPNVLGYDNQQYYIKPGVNGYVAICHANDNLEPQGSLQISAFPESDFLYYGFGVLFGWAGGGLSTTDACIFGVRRNFLGYTEAVFLERASGVNSASTQVFHSVTLDNNPHTLRVALHASGLAQGYLDERFIAEHRFTRCSAGPVGFVAWGPGDKKIYFDDFKLFGLP